MSSRAGDRSIRAKAAKIDEILTGFHGREELPARRPDPLDTLVETILSQNTSDLNSHRAFEHLRRAYPRWDSLLGADPNELAKVIRSGGLADIKSRRIIESLEYIRSQRGTLSLAFLRKMTAQEADAWLSHMKGVGPKTRAIVVLFSLGKPMFPVDTHVFRVTTRIGLIPKGFSRGEAQERLAQLVGEGEYYPFHIALIRHGRTICVARGPRCQSCPVKGLCRFYREVYRKRGGS